LIRVICGSCNGRMRLDNANEYKKELVGIFICDNCGTEIIVKA